MDRIRRNNHIVSQITRDQRGQTLVLALMILFMLVFIGGLFVTMVVKNLGRTARSGQTMSADYLAETAIRYASDQLTYSIDGADWRPVPTFPDVISPTSPLDLPNPDDPDYIWLNPPQPLPPLPRVQPWCRFTYGNGRFLLRVTYDPKYGDPLSKYIKIEAIGRVGVVDENDPTTMAIRQPIRLRSELVAYKAIAITDYARFITNLDRRSEPFALGVPAYTESDGNAVVRRPFVTQYGDMGDIDHDGIPDDTDNDGRADRAHGGSVRVNGNLMWYGSNYIWLDRMRSESVEVAGDIIHSVEWDRGNPPPVDGTVVCVNPMVGMSPAFKLIAARQSSDPLFNSNPDGQLVDVGAYRDGRGDPDVSLRPRSIERLDPPLLDVTGPAGGTGRYRELTRNSGDWVYNTTLGQNAWYNTGYYGWGKGLYINNINDIQTESELKTLRDDWMNPGGSQYWSGPYYTPPGVLIVLTPYDLDNADGGNIMTNPDMILMQTSTSGAKFDWHDANGDVMTATAGQIIMPYPKNGVIFAEGNIRIRGTLPPHTQLTVVSGGTIYVEGNILKCNVDMNGDALVDENKNLLAPDAPRDSGISLLANDYVCVNTTQFFGPAPESQTSGAWRPDIGAYAASVDHPLSFNFDFGVNPAGPYSFANPQLPVRAYVRHSADNGPAYMNMTVNQAGVGTNPDDLNDPWFGLYHFQLAPWCTQAPTLPIALEREYIYPMADIEAAPSFYPGSLPPNPLTDPLNQTQLVAEHMYPMWEHQVFTIYDPVVPRNYAFNIHPGARNLIGFGLDQNMAKSDYLLSRIAVQPCDIRIEALIYAQNGSFFVIPGEWFNPDAEDTYDNFAKQVVAGVASFGRKTRERIDARWPFHGDPLDVKITIYGAISENVSAPVSDETAWMDKWGWIPPIHGSPISPNPLDLTVSYRSPLDPEDDGNGTTVPGGAFPLRQRGLSIIYDNQLSYPRIPNPASPNDRTQDIHIRVDDYGRPLPITPKLPVSPQTLYFGEPT